MAFLWILYGSFITSLQNGWVSWQFSVSPRPVVQSFCRAAPPPPLLLRRNNYVKGSLLSATHAQQDILLSYFLQYSVEIGYAGNRLSVDLFDYVASAQALACCTTVVVNIVNDDSARRRR
jgi:hypothetical protein